MVLNDDRKAVPDDAHESARRHLEILKRLRTRDLPEPLKFLKARLKRSAESPHAAAWPDFGLPILSERKGKSRRFSCVLPADAQYRSKDPAADEQRPDLLTGLTALTRKAAEFIFFSTFYCILHGIMRHAIIKKTSKNR